ALTAFTLLRHIDNEPAPCHIHLRNEITHEGDHLRRAFALEPDFQNVPGTEIMDGDHLAHPFAIWLEGAEPNKIRVVIFLLLGWREPIALDIELSAAQRLSGSAILNARDARDHTFRRDANHRDLELPLSRLILKRTVGCNVLRRFGEAVNKHVPPNAVRGADSTKQDPRRSSAHSPAP